MAKKVQLVDRVKLVLWVYKDQRVILAAKGHRVQLVRKGLEGTKVKLESKVKLDELG
jgi:hypothetical protein